MYLRLQKHTLLKPEKLNMLEILVYLNLHFQEAVMVCHNIVTLPNTGIEILIPPYYSCSLDRHSENGIHNNSG